MQNKDESNHKAKYKLVESIMECIKIVEEILMKQNIIALDCEGVFLSKEGRLTLIQICLPDGQVFIFDILKGGSLMFLGLDEEKRGLKAILENKKILKLIHDCRNDWDSLLYQYSVRIYHFIDTQEAYFIFRLFYYQEITLPISLFKFIEIMTKAKLEYKQKFKNVMNEDPCMWSNRPLSEEQLAYASEDVVYLISAWTNLREKFNENLIEIICFLTILKVVDYAMFDQFKEYLIANIIYFGMLENVFSSKHIYSYLFSLDYIYNFLQIRKISEKSKEDCKLFSGETNLLPDENYYKFVRDEKTSASIIKYGINFKNKQRILSLKHFKEEEMETIEDTISQNIYYIENTSKSRKNSNIDENNLDSQEKKDTKETNQDKININLKSNSKLMKGNHYYSNFNYKNYYNNKTLINCGSKNLNPPNKKSYRNSYSSHDSENKWTNIYNNRINNYNSNKRILYFDTKNKQTKNNKKFKQNNIKHNNKINSTAKIINSDNSQNTNPEGLLVEMKTHNILEQSEFNYKSDNDKEYLLNTFSKNYLPSKFKMTNCKRYYYNLNRTEKNNISDRKNPSPPSCDDTKFRKVSI